LAAGAILPEVDGAAGSGGTEEISGGADHGRCKVGIVRVGADDRLRLDERLIFPVEVKARLDSHRTTTKLFCMAQRGREAAHRATGVGVPFEDPVEAVGRKTVAGRRRETPIRKPGPHHPRGERARQRGVVQPCEPADRDDLQATGSAPAASATGARTPAGAHDTLTAQSRRDRPRRRPRMDRNPLPAAADADPGRHGPAQPLGSSRLNISA
jgi:hypothetical protein